MARRPRAKYTPASMELKQQRIDECNKVIKSISSYGREFFRYKDRVAQLVLSKDGRVYFIDEYTQEVIYTHRRYCHWRGFNNGGTLKSLIEAMRDHVIRGDLLRLGFICAKRSDDSNIWGYESSEAKKLIEEIKDSPIFAKVEEK